MNTNNSKHPIPNRTTQINKKIVLLLELIDAVSGVSEISSYVTNKSWIRFFVHVWLLKNSAILQSLLHSYAHMLGLQAHFSSHARCFIGFLHSHWHLPLFDFCFELQFLHSTFIPCSLFGIHLVPTGSSTVLKLPSHFLY